MRDNKKGRHGLAVLFMCGTLGALTALGASAFRERAERPVTLTWRLETPILYGEDIEKQVIEKQGEGKSFLLWQKKRQTVIENPEYGRQRRVPAYGIAGDSAALFPGENVLPAGETGRCLLGSETAWQLFGSTDVAGRRVKIDGKEYVVSGVEFARRKACVYELEPGMGKKLTHAAVFCGSAEANQMAKQEISRAIG